jgi:hypothetical protein
MEVESNSATIKGAIFAELYVRSLSASLDIFCDLLGMHSKRVEADFAELHHGDSSKILLNSQPIESFDAHNPIRDLPQGASRGAGVELVVIVANLAEAFSRVESSSLVQVASPIQAREWGASDFRFVHPDGFYVRVSD